MKNVFKRMFAMITTVVAMTLICCCGISANAASVKPAASGAAVISASPVAVSIANVGNYKLQQQGGSGINHDNIDDAYKGVIEFIVKWLKRAGLLVGFFGGAMILWAMKQEDADGKQRGVLTLIAGFGVAALCQGVAMFHLFD